MLHSLIRKKVFISWMLSYWIVMICSLLASLLIYSSAISALNTEIEKVEKSVLQNTQSMIDARLAEIILASSLLQQDKDLMKFAHANNPFYNIDIALSMGDGKARMLQTAGNSMIINDIYLYSLRSGVTLSTRFGINDSSGYDLPTEKLFGLSTDLFTDLIGQVSTHPKFEILPPITPGGLNQILMLYPMFGSSARIEGVLVLSLDTGALLQLRPGELTHFNLLVISGDNNIVSSGKELPYLEELIDAGLPEDSIVIRADRIEYLISAAKSTQSDWTYVMAANLDLFQENLRLVRNRMFILITAFLVLGTTASILLVRRNYSPVSRLLDRAAKLSNKKVAVETNEFKQLENAFQDMFKEKETYSHRLDRQQEQMKAFAIGRLFKGTFSNSQQAEEMLAHEGVMIKNNSFAVVLMTIEDFGLLLNSVEEDPLTAEAEELSFVVVKNVLEEIIATIDNISANVVETDNFISCLINLDCSAHSIMTVESLIRDGLAKIRQYFGLVISAGISGIHESLLGIVRCHQEAQEVLELARSIGAPGDILLYDDRRVSSSKLVQSTRHLEARRLMLNHLLVEDYESAEELAQDFVYSLEKTPFQIAYRRIAQSGLIEDLAAALDTLCGEQECLRRPSADIILSELFKAETLTDFHYLMSRFFTELKLIREEKDRLYHNDEKLQQIVDYVEKNIKDFNLSVTAVSEAVNLSLSQLTRLMRSKMGLGTLDYIRKCRIEKAKKLLAQTDLSASEISRLVGYENFRTMNSIFKKFEGITGTQYRENERKR